MNILSLDLEMNQNSGTIIQIGIVMGDIYSGDILEKKSWIIYTDEIINPYITQLTTITQEMVSKGVTILEAYEELVELYDKRECLLNFATWGGGDHRELMKQLYEYCKKNNIQREIKWHFGHREYDVKTIFLAFAIAQKLKVRSGLAKSMTRIGLRFKGTKHWAPDDAENTFTMLAHLVKKLPKDVLTK